MSHKTSDVFRAGYFTVDGTLNSNNSQLYFRPLQGPAHSVSGDFFSLSTNEVQDVSLRINHWSSNGSFIEYGLLYDSDINPPPKQVGNGLHLLGGAGGIIYSFDEYAWLSGLSVFQGPNSYCSAIASNGPLIVAGGLVAGVPAIYSSSNGQNWKLSANATALFGADLSGCNALATSGPLWVAGATNRLLYSYDGNYWYLSNSPDSLLVGVCFALAYNGSQWIAGGNGLNSILYSYDGRSWNFSSSGANQLPICRSVAWDGGQWIAGGIKNGSGSLASSYDGTTWTTVPIPGLLRISCNAIASNGTMWVAGGIDISNNTLIYSYNGINWFNGIQQSILTACYTITWADNSWFAGGAGTNILLRSSDGIIWVPVKTAPTPLTICYTSTVTNPIPNYGPPFVPTNPLSIMGGNASVLINSTDGITWDPVPSVLKDFSDGICRAVRWNGKQWLAGFTTSENKLGYSYDGIIWTASSIATSYLGLGCFAIETNGTLWVAGGNGLATLISSEDGINWKNITPTNVIPSPVKCSAIAWSGSRWVAAVLNNYNTILYSDTNDASVWQSSQNGNTIFGSICNGLAYNGTLWVGVGNTIAFSRDGSTWRNSTITSGTWNTVAWNGVLWLAGGTSGLAYSYDALIWTLIDQPVLSICNAITWTGSLWIATGVPKTASQSSSAYSYNGMTWIPSPNSLDFIGTGSSVAANRTLVNAGTTINPPVFRPTSSSNIGKMVYTTGLNDLYTSSTFTISDASGYLDMSGSIGINCVPNVAFDVSGSAHIRGDLSANSLTLTGYAANHTTTFTTSNLGASQETRITQTTPSAGYISLGSSQLNPQTLFIRDKTTSRSGYIDITDGSASSVPLQIQGGTNSTIIPMGLSTTLRLGASSDFSSNILLTSDATIFTTKTRINGNFGIDCDPLATLDISGNLHVRGDMSANSLTLTGYAANYTTTFTTSNFGSSQETRITQTAPSAGYISVGSSQLNPHTLVVRDKTEARSGYIEITDGSANSVPLQLQGGTNATMIPLGLNTTLRLGAASDISNNIVLTNSGTSVNTQFNVAGPNGQLQIAQTIVDGYGNISQITTQDALNGFITLGSSQIADQTLFIRDEGTATSGYIAITDGTRAGRAIDIRGGNNGTICPNANYTTLRIGANTDSSSNIFLSNMLTTVNTKLNINGNVGIGCDPLVPLDVSGAAHIRGDLSANSIRIKGTGATYSTTFITSNFGASQETRITQSAPSAGFISVGSSQLNPQTLFVQDRTVAKSGYVAITNGLGSETALFINGGNTCAIVPNATGTSLRLGAASDVSNNIVLTSAATTINGPLKVASVAGGATNQLQIVNGLVNVNERATTINQTATAGNASLLQLGSSSYNPTTVWIRDSGTANSGYVDITDGTPSLALRLTGGANTLIRPNNSSNDTSLTLGANSTGNNIVLTNSLTTINGDFVSANGNIRGNGQLNLGANTASANNIVLTQGYTTINTPVTINGTLTVTGNLTAPNIVNRVIGSSAINVSPGTGVGAVTLTNTGVRSVQGSTAITVSAPTGDNITITNTGVRSVQGSTGITVSANTGDNITIINNGVRSVQARNGIRFSPSAGDCTLDTISSFTNKNFNISNNRVNYGGGNDPSNPLPSFSNAYNYIVAADGGNLIGYINGVRNSPTDLVLQVLLEQTPNTPLNTPTVTLYNRNTTGDNMWFLFYKYVSGGTPTAITNGWSQVSTGGSVNVIFTDSYTRVILNVTPTTNKFISY
jgi:hypothetical protein